jgi:flagellin
MGFSINTNVSSLQSQEYLRVTSDFQSKTINRVTSGLRIVSSGDDAAGLAIANGYRSDQAVLSQGIRNANDGLSQLQIVDGGINNISKLLDRARTLATQSASGTFTGSRAVLNSEFQSVVTEIDRQAQAIGLDTGGSLAKSLSVFVGGGKASGGVTATSNGSVAVDLSTSTVDARSLGLKGFQAVGTSGVDIGVGAGDTSVANIAANATNTGSVATSGFSKFYFSGAGFADGTGANRVGVDVNLAGVSDTSTLVTNINAAIASAANGTSQEAVAFKNAGIKAVAVTDSNGAQRLGFTSSTAAFNVQAGDRVANAFLGNFETPSSALGRSALASTTASGVAVSNVAPGAADNDITLRITKNGVNTDVTVSLATTDITRQQKLDKLNAGLTTAGLDDELTASLDGSNNLVFTSKQGGQTFEVQAANDQNNYFGLGTFQGGFASTSVTGAAAPAAGSQTVEISVNGGTKISLGSLTATGTIGTDVDTLNNAIQANSTLRAAGVIARDNGAGNVQLVSRNGDNIRVNTIGGTDAFGFGITGAASAGSLKSDFAGTAGQIVSAGGVSNTAVGTNNDVLSFNGIRTSGVSQQVTLSGTDSSGALQSISLTLNSSNSGSIDDALSYINTQLENSNNSTLKKLVATKDVNFAGDGEGIRFVSSLSSFKVSLGTTSVGDSSLTEAVGLFDGTASAGSRQGVVVSSENATGGSTADITTQAGAEAAVAALATAVESLGTAQAVVGRGQNSFNYAINLASSQLTNLAASESRIRDADLALEAANLTKAQIGLQAGIAALSQANSAPQQVLSLLRG